MKHVSASEAQQKKTTGAEEPMTPEDSARAHYERSLKVKGHLIKAVLGSSSPPDPVSLFSCRWL